MSEAVLRWFLPCSSEGWGNCLDSPFPDPTQLGWGFVALALGVVLGFEMYRLTPHWAFSHTADRIPNKKSQRLEVLEGVDVAFILFNKVVTVLFTYHVLQFMWHSSTVYYATSPATLLSIPFHLLLFFVVYDLPYTLFHRALHIPAVYPYIHKHHHKQHAPFRGNLDAINVHPFEYVVGEYNHIFAMWVVSLLVPVHAASVLLFILVGGFLASLNHTRYDVRIGRLYTVEAHDSHHRIDVMTNFGQYSMLWDYLLGSYRHGATERMSPPPRGAVVLRGCSGCPRS